MWVRFIDDVGNRLGDRDVRECPSPEDQVELGVEGPVTYRVRGRLWMPDWDTTGAYGYRIAVLVRVERT